MIEIWVCEDGHEFGYIDEPKIKKCCQILGWPESEAEAIICLKPIKKDRTIPYMQTEKS